MPPEEAPAPNPSPRLTCPKVANYLAARHGVTVTAEYVRQLTLTGEIPSQRLSERKLLIATDDLDTRVEHGRTPTTARQPRDRRGRGCRGACCSRVAIPVRPRTASTTRSRTCRSRVVAMADRNKFVWRPGDVTVWKPEVLGIVDGLELGDDLDVEASSVTTSIPAWTDNDGSYWSDPDR